MRFLKMLARVITLPTLLLCLLCLSGCQQRTVSPAPEEITTALLDLTVREDSTALQDLLGYTDEASLYKDFEVLIQEINAGIQTHFLGPLGKIPDGVVLPYQYIYSAALVMLSKLTITSEVTTLENDRAVLTLHLHTYDMMPCLSGVTAWMRESNSILQAVDSAFVDSYRGSNGSEKQVAAQQLFYNTEYAFMAEVMKSLEPTENESEFQSVFVLTEMRVNGKMQTLWLPENPEAFGKALIDTALVEL